jgi:hypothetical protein
MMESVSTNINGKPTAYKPGNWFNSAKFFEYQTYGWVWATAKENEVHFTGNMLQEKKSAFHLIGK